jgi:hypothetical protein
MGGAGGGGNTTITNTTSSQTCTGAFAQNTVHPGRRRSGR